MNISTYKAVFDNLNLGIAVLDSNLLIVETNECLRKWFGHIDFSTLPHYSILLPDNLKQLWILKENQKIIIPIDIENQKNYLEATCLPSDSDSFIISIQNITECVKQKRQVTESDIKFNHFFEHNKAIMLQVDTVSKQIKHANKAAIDFYGYTKEELTNRTINDLHTLSPEEINQLMKKAIQQNASFFSFRHRLANNEIKDVEVYASPVKYGTQSQMFLIIYDVTEHITAQKLLYQQNEKLKSINAEKDKFFSIISHDLKTPFIGILGFSELLKDNITTFTPDELFEIVTSINHSAVQTFALLENLLKWSGLKQGKINTAKKTHLLKDLIDPEIEVIQETALLKKITIEQNINPPLEIYADREMLQTIIRNLLANAIKFSNKGGIISINAKTEGNFCLISVKDTGVGIAANQQDKLFRLSETISTQGTQQEKGTGLGLLLCKDFVEKHNGKIWVESKWEKGSTFYFTIENNAK